MCMIVQQSQLAEANTARRPSGVTATPKTVSSWPSSVCTILQVSKSHTQKLKFDAEMARRPGTYRGVTGVLD